MWYNYIYLYIRIYFKIDNEKWGKKYEWKEHKKDGCKESCSFDTSLSQNKSQIHIAVSSRRDLKQKGSFKQKLICPLVPPLPCLEPARCELIYNRRSARTRPTARSRSSGYIFDTSESWNSITLSQCQVVFKAYVRVMCIQWQYDVEIRTNGTSRSTRACQGDTWLPFLVIWSKISNPLPEEQFKATTYDVDNQRCLDLSCYWTCRVQARYRSASTPGTSRVLRSRGSAECAVQ